MGDLLLDWLQLFAVVFTEKGRARRKDIRKGRNLGIEARASRKLVHSENTSDRQPYDEQEVVERQRNLKHLCVSYRTHWGHRRTQSGG